MPSGTLVGCCQQLFVQCTGKAGLLQRGNLAVYATLLDGLFASV